MGGSCLGGRIKGGKEWTGKKKGSMERMVEDMLDEWEGRRLDGRTNAYCEGSTHAGNAHYVPQVWMERGRIGRKGR